MKPPTEHEAERLAWRGAYHAASVAMGRASVAAYCKRDVDTALRLTLRGRQFHKLATQHHPAYARNVTQAEYAAAVSSGADL